MEPLHRWITRVIVLIETPLQLIIMLSCIAFIAGLGIDAWTHLHSPEWVMWTEIGSLVIFLLAAMIYAQCWLYVWWRGHLTDATIRQSLIGHPFRRHILAEWGIREDRKD